MIYTLVMKKIFPLIILLAIAIALPPNANASTSKKVIKKVVRKPTKKKVILASETINQIKASVPFYYQAINGSWSNPKLADGCEEASIIMAAAWAENKSYSAQEVHDLIISISDYEQEKFGFFEDSSAVDTASLLKERLGVKSVLRYDISVEEIRNSILAGNIAIIPVNGDKLGNPHYSSPGPVRHTVIVTGYIPSTNQFILNDPGTQYGYNFIVSAANLQNSLQDYPSGKHQKVTVIRPAMIEVYKQAAIQQ